MTGSTGLPMVHGSGFRCQRRALQSSAAERIMYRTRSPSFDGTAPSTIDSPSRSSTEVVVRWGVYAFAAAALLTMFASARVHSSIRRASSLVSR